MLEIFTSVVPYVALFVAMYYALDVSYWLTLALAVPASGFALRSYIIFHDCAHGSFLPSKRANAWLGKATGLMLFHAFYPWRHSHAVHHASAGDLDRRGVGDLPTMTVAEYHDAPFGKRLRLPHVPQPVRHVHASGRCSRWSSSPGCGRATCARASSAA